MIQDILNQQRVIERTKCIEDGVTRSGDRGDSRERNQRPFHISPKANVLPAFPDRLRPFSTTPVTAHLVVNHRGRKLSYHRFVAPSSLRHEGYRPSAPGRSFATGANAVPLGSNSSQP